MAVPFERGADDGAVAQRSEHPGRLRGESAADVDRCRVRRIADGPQEVGVDRSTRCAACHDDTVGEAAFHRVFGGVFGGHCRQWSCVLDKDIRQDRDRGSELCAAAKGCVGFAFDESLIRDVGADVHVDADEVRPGGRRNAEGGTRIVSQAVDPERPVEVLPDLEDRSGDRRNLVRRQRAVGVPFGERDRPEVLHHDPIDTALAQGTCVRDRMGDHGIEPFAGLRITGHRRKVDHAEDAAGSENHAHGVPRPDAYTVRVAVLVHVGLHKTATTFLQQSFFPGLRETTFVHATHELPARPNPIQRFVWELLFRNPAVLDVQAHRRAISTFVEAQPGHTIVSSEALFGWPFENHVNFLSNADLLAQVLPDAKIWLVLRRQDSWLESAYSQVLKQGLSTTPQAFSNYRHGTFGDFNWNIYNGPNLDVRDLDWRSYVRHYQRRFPAGVLVQPFESFVADASGFLGRLCDFAGVETFVPEAQERVNVAFSPVSAATARLVNALPLSVKMQFKQWVPRQLHPAAVLNRVLDPLLARRSLMPAELKQAALALHAKANADLAELIGEDLATYGYC